MRSSYLKFEDELDSPSARLGESSYLSSVNAYNSAAGAPFIMLNSLVPPSNSTIHENSLSSVVAYTGGAINAHTTLTSFDPIIDNDPAKAAKEKMVTIEPYQLPIPGQGVVSVRIKPGQVLWIVLRIKNVCIVLQITEDTVNLTNGFNFANNGNAMKDIQFVRGTSSAPLTPDLEDIYWLSLSKSGDHVGELRYGRTFRSTTCTLLKTNVGDRSWTDNLKYVHVLSLQGSAVKPTIRQIRIDRYPIVIDLAPVIADNSELTLLDIDANSKISVANLHPVCQRLYANICGPSIKVNDKDFHDFIDAIEWGIKKPSSMIYKKLLEKSGHFGKDEQTSSTEISKTTYLRVTLGLDEGRSPGIPYVMEIWPAGHQSPIHNHGEAYAIIKVLHGEITSRYFKTLIEDRPTPYRVETYEAGDVTWMDPDHYQVHQLYNHSDQVCVTIQCYGYSKQQDQHDETFTFLKEQDGRPTRDTGNFIPTSDWSFQVFRKELKREWMAWKGRY